VERTGRLITNYGRLDQLTPEQQSEVRQAGLEQNDITSKLDGARKDIRQIQRRGVYNKIYNEAAAAKLQGALDELDRWSACPAKRRATACPAWRPRSSTVRPGSRAGRTGPRRSAKASPCRARWRGDPAGARLPGQVVELPGSDPHRPRDQEQQERNNKEIKKTGGGK